MRIDKRTTIVIKDDNGKPIDEGDVLLFVADGRTRLAYFNGLDHRSRAVMVDYTTGEQYACMLGSIKDSRVLDAKP